MTMIGRFWDSKRTGWLGKWASRSVECYLLTIAIKLAQTSVQAHRFFQFFSSSSFEMTFRRA